MNSKAFLLSLAFVTLSFAQSSMARSCKGSVLIGNGTNGSSTNISVIIAESSVRNGTIELQIPAALGDMPISTSYQAVRGKNGTYQFNADLGDGVNLKGQFIMTRQGLNLLAALELGAEKMDIIAPDLKCE